MVEYSPRRLLFDPELIWVSALLMFVAEIVVNILVIEKVPYTEIDWQAYMQEVGGVLNGTLDYNYLKGDTGPLVYPAGFVYFYSCLYFITNQGRNVRLAQYIFAVIYLINLSLVFRIYKKLKKVPPYVLVFMCCTSYRIHSIYILRLFNDPIAMLLLYMAINLMLIERWTFACVLYSLAVSVKMNILLFSPALLLVLINSGGLWKTFLNLACCGSIQLVLGLPFLLVNPRSYIIGAFNFSRVFLYEWTVNWKFISEELFVSHWFHLFLLSLHLGLLAVYFFRWKRYFGFQIWSGPDPKRTLSTETIVLLLFTCNFIGVAVSRSLHYQFYVWYYHSLPFLLWSTELSNKGKLCMLGMIELCWNTFPATASSSLLLHFCHAVILVYLWFPVSSNIMAQRKLQ